MNQRFAAVITILLIAATVCAQPDKDLVGT
jgi:hypothetical protein